MRVELAALLVVLAPSASSAGGGRSVFLRASQQQQLQLQQHRSLAIAGCPGEEDFEVTFEEHCSYDNIRTEVSKLKTDTCNASDDDLMIDLLGASDLDDARTKATALCADAYANSAEKFAFEDITHRGKQFDNEFYSGGTHWNYEIETDDGENVLKEDAARVKRIHDDQAQKKVIDLPTYLPSFDPDQDGCDINAAFCCWVQDRQAGDNNGNCNTPYESQCIDKDPGDNANFCYTDHARSSPASHVSGGFSIFGDVLNGQENIEGSIHCHGFAWAQDGTDISSVYKGNNLFFVSMYDHMHQRGYVRNAPGSPMCGCAENMAVVTRADCTEIAATETFTFNYVAANDTFSGLLTEVNDINFNSCTGAAQNNDLESYYERLVDENKQSQENLDTLRETLVGAAAGNCNQAIVDFMATKGIVRPSAGAAAPPDGAATADGAESAAPKGVEPIDPAYADASQGGGPMPAVPTDGADGEDETNSDKDAATSTTEEVTPNEILDPEPTAADDTDAPTPSEPVEEEKPLKNEGEKCGNGRQCRSGCCHGDGLCAAIGTDCRTAFSGGEGGTACKAEGESCRNSNDCCDGSCGGNGQNKVCGAS